jgi:hypothetical protein
VSADYGLNPLTYVSKGVRASLVPEVPHLPLWLCVVVTVLVIQPRERSPEGPGDHHG